MRSTVQDVLEKTGIMVIDGSMGFYLDALGCDLNDNIWTAKVLAERPDMVKQVHLGYFRAGADCGITCSYQATIPGLMTKGYTESEAEDIIASSVRVFQDARDQWWEEEGHAAGRAYPLCLASVGPYGAYLADGSEYRGNYRVSDQELREFHYRRMELLWNAGADILLMETQPSLREVLVEAKIAEELGADYWVSFSCRDGSHTCEGDSIAQCAEALGTGHPHLRMVGVNCTFPQLIEPLIKEWRDNIDLPVAVYPNGSEGYDPETKTWSNNVAASRWGEYALRWMQDGAKAVGGCCGTLPEHIKEVAKAREIFLKGKTAK